MGISLNDNSCPFVLLLFKRIIITKSAYHTHTHTKKWSKRLANCRLSKSHNNWHKFHLCLYLCLKDTTIQLRSIQFYINDFNWKKNCMYSWTKNHWIVVHHFDYISINISFKHATQNFRFENVEIYTNAIVESYMSVFGSDFWLFGMSLSCTCPTLFHSEWIVLDAFSRLCCALFSIFKYGFHYNKMWVNYVYI